MGEELKSFPSAIDVESEVGMVCCAIHRRIHCGVEGAVGCEGWSSGTHRSIAVLYDGLATNSYCHAQMGQLVLDRVVAEESLLMRKRGNSALGVVRVMAAKYYRGYHVSVSSYGAGYCYLIAFPSEVRSRVARILGPLPLVADVLRLMRVLGASEVNAIWRRVGIDVYHVEPLSNIEHDRPGLFFEQGFSLLRTCGKYVRVGVDMGDLFGCSYILSRLQSACRHVVDFFPKRSDGLDASGDDSRSSESGVVSSLLGNQHGFDKGDNDSVPQLLVKSDLLCPPLKGFCDRCGFLVTKEGHEARCRIAVEKVDLFAVAWMGDVMHRRDVRMALLLSGRPKASLGAIESELVSATAQASYYRGYSGEKVNPNGFSDRSVSTAFEASYHGLFRIDYFNAILLPYVSGDVVPHGLSVFFHF